MKHELFLRALNEINDDYILEAAPIQVGEARTISFWRGLSRTVVAAVLVVAFLTGTASASVAIGVEPVYLALHSISPGFARMLKPVRRSCVDNGIEMEAVGASIHDDTAQVLVTMRDLTGDRIDATTDLFDSEEFLDSYDSAGTCQLENYDEETGTATFAVLISHMNHEKFQGDKVTFRVGQFLSQKHTYEGTLPLDLTTADVDPEVFHLGAELSRGMSFLEQEPQNTICLVPQKLPVYTPVDGAQMTGLGYTDNQLHVQVHYDDILSFDNHGWIQLQGADGSDVSPAYSESFWDDDHKGSYYEYVFDVPYEELAKYTIYTEIITCNTLTKGNWEVTFPLNNVLE